jgi:hypothetical protein
MKKSIFVSIIFVMAVCGCGQKINSMLTATSTAPHISEMPSSITSETPKAGVTETPWPTLIYYLYPTITPNPERTPPTPQPTITAPPRKISPTVLPSNLGIEEYRITEKDNPSIETLAFSRHTNPGGWYYWPKGGLIDGKLFQATEKIISYQFAEIHATLAGTEIFVEDCGQVMPFSNLITAWAYEEHWIIQTVCHKKFDIFWDGKSLNAEKGYQSSFAFQILGQHPFYLFTRNDQVWLSYHAEEVLLGYDEVKLTYCCMSYRPPQHYENLITFYATKNNQLYYVVIGLFDE